MKIVSIADLQIGESSCGHFDPISGLHTREVDFFNSIDKSVDFALDDKNEIGLFTILGDIYLDRKPTMTQQREFAKRIARLSNAKKETIILKGNHDIPEADGAAHTSSVIQAFSIPYVTVVDEPQILYYEDIAIVAMPYVSQRRLRVKTIEEAVEYYKETVKTLRSQTGKKKNICLIHQTVEKAVMPAGYRDLSTMNELVIPLETFKDFDIVIGGHIHKHQAVQKKPPVLYVGSIDRVDFGEAGEEKGFIVYDSDKDKVNFAKLDVREFLDIKVDVTKESDQSIQQRILMHLTTLNFKEKIVKLTIKINDNDIVQVDIQELNKTIKKEAFYFKGAVFDVVRMKRTRDEKMSESLSILSALKAYVESKSEYAKIKDEMIKVGSNIIEEIKSK